MDTASLQLEEQAIEWLLRLESETSPECRKRFMEWCEASRHHVQAFLEATVLDRQLDRIDPQRKIDLEALVSECRQAARDNVVDLGVTQTPTPSSGRIQSRGVRWGLAAGLLAVLIGFTLLRLAHNTSSIYGTHLGEQRSIKLGDGSVVYLNTRSRIRAQYSDRMRDIDLLEGEAYFVVAPDRERPFRVVAGGATVEAVGTQFNVYREGPQTTVSVIEGKVKLATNSLPVPLSAGEAAQVVASGRIVKEKQPEVRRSTVWRQRQLDFRRASLYEVAAQFNRYNATQLKIEDREVGERLLNGVFDADAPEQLIRFLEQRNDLSFERRPREILILRRSK